MNDESVKYIVEEALLPTVLIKVMEAKRLLSQGIAKSASDAARIAGISRSAFYKYKDGISVYSENQGGSIHTYYLTLMDKSGVLAPVLSVLTKYGANILTINQNIPVDGASLATISFSSAGVTADGHAIREEIRAIDGVISCSSIAGDK